MHSSNRNNFMTYWFPNLFYLPFSLMKLCYIISKCWCLYDKWNAINLERIWYTSFLNRNGLNSLKIDLFLLVPCWVSSTVRPCQYLINNGHIFDRVEIQKRHIRDASWFQWEKEWMEDIVANVSCQCFINNKLFCSDYVENRIISETLHSFSEKRKERKKWR